MRTVPAEDSFLPAVCIVKAKGCPTISAFPTIRRGKRISGRQSFVAFERILFAGQWFQIYYKGLLFRIFRILSTQYDFSLSKEQKQTMNWIVFEEISDYIRAHFRDITIQDLVDEFHYQEDYFNRLIKRKTGLTYSAYVQQIRLERAEHLLVSTDKSIEEIADSVGYHNKGYFYKLFQEKYEETPASYRRHTR